MSDPALGPALAGLAPAITAGLAPVLAGIVYVITPGPATLAVLGIAATEGRGSAVRFYLGHGVGDITWAVLALAAILGASRLGPELFAALGIACGVYLAYLGWQALTSRASTATSSIGGGNPVRTGLLFGLTNPKAYPFSLAMFGALSVGQTADFGVADAGRLLGGVILGFVIGDAITLYWAGLAPVRVLFMRFRHGVLRAMGVLFIAFGVGAIWEAGAGLRAR